MDVITQVRLLWLGGLAVVYGIALGTVLLLSAVGNRRAQHRSSLLDSVLQQFPRKLRDQIAIQPRATVFGRRAVIEFDMGHHAPEEWWPIVTGLSRNLAPDVRLLVRDTDALPFPVTLSIKPK